MEKGNEPVMAAFACPKCMLEVEKERKKWEENQAWDDYERMTYQAKRGAYSSPPFLFSLWCGISFGLLLLVMFVYLGLVGAYYSCKGSDPAVLKECQENQISLTTFVTVCAGWIFATWIPLVIIVGAVVVGLAVVNRLTSHVYLPFTNPEK